MLPKSVIILSASVVIFAYLTGYCPYTACDLKFLPLTVSDFHVIYEWFVAIFETTVRDNGTDAIERNDKLFTPGDLMKYNSEKTGLYLAILGKVYDVGKGKKYYGHGGSYHFFTGCDGSRAFVTGDFSKTGLTDHVIDLPSEDLRSLQNWVKFYEKEYEYKGKVIGRYYDASGSPTTYHDAVEALIQKAMKLEMDEKKEKELFPPCNVEWSPEEGSRVWCTKMSGGIHRDWIGVPRKFYKPGSNTFRCACVDADLPHMKANLKEYPNCHPKATSCYVHVT